MKRLRGPAGCAFPSEQEKEGLVLYLRVSSVCTPIRASSQPSACSCASGIRRSTRWQGSRRAIVSSFGLAIHSSKNSQRRLKEQPFWATAYRNGGRRCQLLGARHSSGRPNRAVKIPRRTRTYGLWVDRRAQLFKPKGHIK